MKPLSIYSVQVLPPPRIKFAIKRFAIGSFDRVRVCVCAGDDCVVRAWSADHTGWWDCECELADHHKKPILTAAVLGANTLVTCDRHGTAIMWEIGTWEVTSAVENYSGPVWGLQLGDNCIVNGNAKGDVKVWRYEDSGEPALEERVEQLALDSD